MSLRSFVLCFLVACSSSSATSNDLPTPPTPDGGGPTDDGSVEQGDDAGDGSTKSDAKTPDNATRVRIASANTTSGTSTSYDPIESIRIFQGLHIDVVLIQELKYGANGDNDIRQFVTTAFGASYNYYREPVSAGVDIPNGIISKFPILDSGSWDDPNVDNRGFAWAKIQVPDAPHPLWAVSLHLLTSSSSNRDAEAKALVTQIKASVPAADYLVIGGDFNTSVRTEPCITTLSEVVGTAAPYPDDGAGNDNTNGTRAKPHDWLLADTDLAAFSVPVTVGARSFAAGLVFDSRIYKPLTDVAPIMQADSDALNMQHMPVVRDFAFPR